MYTTENLVEGKALMQNLAYQTITGKSIKKIHKLCELHNAPLDLLDNNWVTTVNTILGREGGIFQTERNKPNNKTDLAIKSTIQR